MYRGQKQRFTAPNGGNRGGFALLDVEEPEVAEATPAVAAPPPPVTLWVASAPTADAEPTAAEILARQAPKRGPRLTRAQRWEPLPSVKVVVGGKVDLHIQRPIMGPARRPDASHVREAQGRLGGRRTAQAVRPAPAQPLDLSGPPLSAHAPLPEVQGAWRHGPSEAVIVTSARVMTQDERMAALKAQQRRLAAVRESRRASRQQRGHSQVEYRTVGQAGRRGDEVEEIVEEVIYDDEEDFEEEEAPVRSYSDMVARHESREQLEDDDNWGWQPPTQQSAAEHRVHEPLPLVMSQREPLPPRAQEQEWDDWDQPMERRQTFWAPSRQQSEVPDSWEQLASREVTVS